MPEQQLEISVAGDPEFVAALAEELRARPTGDVLLGDVQEIQAPTDLRLDLGTVADVVGLMSFAFVQGPLVPLLLRTIRQQRPQRIRVSSPLGEVTFEPGRELSEADVRQILREIAEL